MPPRNLMEALFHGMRDARFSRPMTARRETSKKGPGDIPIRPVMIREPRGQDREWRHLALLPADPSTDELVHENSGEVGVPSEGGETSPEGSRLSAVAVIRGTSCLCLIVLTSWSRRPDKRGVAGIGSVTVGPSANATIQTTPRMIQAKKRVSAPRHLGGRGEAPQVRRALHAGDRDRYLSLWRTWHGPQGIVAT